MKTKTLSLFLVALLVVGCRGVPGMWGTPKHRPNDRTQESTQGSAHQQNQQPSQRDEQQAVQK